MNHASLAEEGVYICFFADVPRRGMQGPQRQGFFWNSFKEGSQRLSRRCIR